MSQQPAPPPEPKKLGEPRYVVLIALTAIGTLLGGLVASVAMGALLSFLPALVGVLVGALFGFLLPIFLALRATHAMRRRGLGALLRRLVMMALIACTQLAVFGAVLTWTSRTTGDLAATGFKALDTFGGLPLISGMLETHAVKKGALKKKPKPVPLPGPDGGVLIGPDGGVLYADAGVEVVDVVDAGTAAAGDGGVALASDGGTAALPPVVVPSGLLPKPPSPVAGATLSPRAAGKAVRTFAAVVQTDAGDQAIVVGNVAAAGSVTTRVIDLAAHDRRGAPTLVEVADDGSVAAILDGTHLVVARAGKTTADVIKGVTPGIKLGETEIRGTKDVVIAPGGAMLAVIEVIATAGTVEQRFVSIPKTGPIAVLRAKGDAVPDAEGSSAFTWAFKRTSGSGSVLVAETFLDGGNDVGFRMTGENYSLNPQRLLVVKIDAPKAQLEVARTGLEANGIEGLELQVFGDAALLPDGRAIFDANFIEKGIDGWLFSGKPGAGVFALGADLRAGGGPFTSTPPRVQHLDAIVEGTAIYRRSDGAVVMFQLDAPRTSAASLLGADAIGSDGKKRGTITNVDVPMLTRGGEWIVASATVAGRDAIVLASRQDRENGIAEVVLESGGTLPVAGAATPKKIQSIRFAKREEILWRK